MKTKLVKNIFSDEFLARTFCSRRGGFALDSSLRVDKLGSWSFFGADPFEWIQGGENLNPIKSLIKEYGFSYNGELPFVGGAVGFISYDYGRRLENIPNISKPNSSIPDFCFGLYDQFIAKNLVSGEVFLVASEVRKSAEKSFEELELILAKGEVDDHSNNEFIFKEWKWDTSKEEFINSVKEIKRLISKGDVYQVNLSLQRQVGFEGSIVDLYCALRSGNPAPYGGYFNAENIKLLSTSPEQFLKKTGSKLYTRPIKGTRPRGKDFKEEKRLASDLISSEKDRAELLMIIDLERNDLGKISKFGTIEADTEFNIEYYKSVMHATAEVRSELSKDKDIFEAINALFPGGSITGAPKIKAMEVIESLEKNRRGLYCGSFGYIGFNQDAELNISIRSLIYNDNILFYNVGSGIVWDSIPIEEYRETMAKGNAIDSTLKNFCKLT